MGIHWNVFLYFAYQILTLEGVSHGLYVLWLVVEKNQTPATVALILAAGDLTLTFFELPSGRLADRYGRKLSLCAGSICQVLGVLALWQCDSSVGLTLACMLIGLADALRDGADESLLYETLSQLDRADRFGPVVALARQRAQYVLVLFLLGGGWLATHWGFGWVWLAEILLATLGLLAALCLTDITTHPERETEVPSSQSLLPWRQLYPSVAVVSMAAATSFAVEASWSGSAQLLTALVALTMLFEGFGAGLAANPLWGTLKLTQALVKASLLLLGLVVVVGQEAGWWLAIGASVFTSFCQGVSEPVRSRLVQEWAEPGRRATAASAAYTCEMLGQTVGLILFGILLESWGLQAACLGLMVLVVSLSVPTRS